MNNLLSIFAIFLCVGLSFARNVEKCTGTGKHCVHKEICINGTIDKSAGKFIIRRSNPSGQCSKYEVCCSVDPQDKLLRKRRDHNHQRQYGVICYRSGDYCVPQEACIDGFIDKTAGGLIKPYLRQYRCRMNEVCCQNSEEKQKKKLCAGTGNYCVPENTCINGTIDTTAGGILDPYSHGSVECTANEVCCSYAKQPEEGVDCNDVGKTCVNENLCVNGIIDIGGGNVIIRRSKGPVKCSVKQICCSYPVEKQKKVMCTDNGKTCVPKNQCLNGTVNTSGINIIELRSAARQICSEDQVCCSLPPQSNQSRVILPARECGQSNPEGLDTHAGYAVARQAKLGEFPWMVQIFERILTSNSSEDDILCAGSLIAANKVVTAAHCVANLTDSDLYVRAGEWNPNALTELYPHTDRFVVKRIIHDKYDHWHPHSDIALLVLKNNFILSKHINTICLPQPDMNFANARCIVSGWGKRSRSDPEQLHTLKKLEVPVVGSATCQRQLQVPFSRHFELHSNFICAGGESHSTCDGDGGAPLMCPIAGSNRYVLAGVLSYGYDCNVKDVPDLYINVPTMRSWILEHLND